MTYFTSGGAIFAYNLDHQVYSLDKNTVLPIYATGQYEPYPSPADLAHCFMLSNVPFGFNELGELCSRIPGAEWRPVTVYHRLQDVPFVRQSPLFFHRMN